MFFRKKKNHNQLDIEKQLFDRELALWDITHNTKKSIEWSLESKELNKYEVLDLVYERIYEILDEHNIKLDDLII